MPLERLRLSEIRKTSTFRLTALLGLVFALGLVVLLGLIYGLSAHELTARSDRILRLEADRLKEVSAEALPDRINAEIRHNASGLTLFGLQSHAGEHVAGNLRVSLDLPFNSPVNISEKPGAHGPLRVLAIRATTGETILIGRDIAPIVDLRHRMLVMLIVSGAAMTLLVLGTGFLLSLAPLRRVRDLQAASREIAAGRLDRRMPISKRGDELDLFAGTVNAMIEEVERVVAQVKGVTDAIAHDLRTPLTHVRGHLQHAIVLADADLRLVELAQAATADLDLVLERFAALLRISELEARGRHAGFATVSVASMLAAAYDLYEPLAEDVGVRLHHVATQDATITCDPKLLFEAISNLLDNAIKFTGAGGEVWLSSEMTGQALAIAVRDNGPGLAADERQAALRRFYRGTDAAGIPGTGLGLSVVAAIAHLHGFDLELGDARPGLIVRIRCPIAAPAD
ncbi:HAMP domain-containing sensor histidine kinase [Sphingomonas sp. NFR15]|uniref:sensor histidine kinase n=1 Tax=Sphingomonas sp. NFR15 TaxID=1566282 RepID=UPI00088084D0|nr:HAMP domain-containing sensor histidine kinase [Sphingomonas sp. NFR15]SDA36718.1 Signal transduction histidine kinase [Sphingomonas sp. NFR15]